jgi:hypothetical protein
MEWRELHRHRGRTLVDSFDNNAEETQAQLQNWGFCFGKCRLESRLPRMQTSTSTFRLNVKVTRAKQNQLVLMAVNDSPSGLCPSSLLNICFYRALGQPQFHIIQDDF